MSGTPSGDSALLVGLGEVRVSRDPCVTLVTYALGSCLGVAVHDAHAGVGGMLHAMMPRSAIDPVRARDEPGMFVDTGIPALFRACYALGARKDRMRVHLAGAASINGEAADAFQIGIRNLLMARRLFEKNGVQVSKEDVGGVTWRNLTLSVGSGESAAGQAPRVRVVVQP